MCLRTLYKSGYSVNKLILKRSYNTTYTLRRYGIAVKDVDQ